MKAGANQMDQAKIKSLAEGGDSAEIISKKLGIEIAVVENFMPKAEKPAKASKGVKSGEDLV